MNIYERIKILSEERNISIKALEKEVGLGNGVIKRWKESSPQCNKLLLVANYLQTSLEYLVTGKEINDITKDEQELLELFRQLPAAEQYKIIGRIETMIEALPEQGKSLDSKIG